MPDVYTGVDNVFTLPTLQTLDHHEQATRPYEATAKGLTLYLAGPMRGYPAQNFPAFKEATAKLRAAGYAVISPAEMDLANGFDPDDPDPDFSIAAALLDDLTAVATLADGIALLPGSESSKGAQAEVALAQALDKPVRAVQTWLQGITFGDTPGPQIATQGLTAGVERVTSATGGQKERKMTELASIDPLALQVLGDVAGYGARKYATFNYLKGYDWDLNANAAMRHFLAFWGGEDRDPESGLPHMAHFAWHGLALVSFLERGLGTDTRFKQGE